MHAEFSSLAKQSRLHIPVPALDMGAIRSRSAASGARERLRRLAAGAALALGAVGAAAALAGTTGAWQVWLFGNKVEAVVRSLAMIREPMAADVRALTHRAAFPVVFPDGVPGGLRVLGIAYSPIERPTMMTIQYGDVSDPWAMAVSLIQTQALAAGEKFSPAGPGQAMSSKGYHFQIGSETVLVQGRNVSSAQVARIRSAMQLEPPAQTAAAFDALLARIVVLQKVTPRVAQVAERIAPPGKNVAVADSDLRIIPRLAARGKPLRDSRTVYATDIPQVHGGPDYRNATLAWPKAFALDPGGVRAVATAMRATHTGANCKCAILVNNSNGAYTLWKIDDKTLKATRL